MFLICETIVIFSEQNTIQKVFQLLFYDLPLQLINIFNKTVNAIFLRQGMHPEYLFPFLRLIQRTTAGVL